MPAGQHLSQRLRELEEQQGHPLKVEEIAEVVHNLLDSMGTDVSALDLEVYKELEALARYIETAKTEIAALRPDDIPETYIPKATDELDAIIEATEVATNAILDAAEIIESVIPSVDPANGATLQKAVTHIYEASNFQDITGQRITRIVNALKYIEDKVRALMVAFGSGIERAREVGVVPAASLMHSSHDTRPDAHLLNGPQLPDVATSQSEIDALLSNSV